ncbi:hypothetical protein [Ktedonobacter robiniae]|jgi:hypothetical protein|uniref:Antitoxin VbhA domain-containing protein n=1 Tax=Ktedonobacter robiniae TaxID=2778365 RepID=A0ABQ3UJK3_9CHLR|nr:hypothetical protein [Ktedonobacter robiniae]GHO52600.1 hypothetical protein KSB_10750 [Ktedonobacter robiniae]
MTAEEREQALWVASQRYINGDIDIDEFEAVEHMQAEKLREAMLSLSWQRVRGSLKRRLFGLWGDSRSA